MIDSLFLILIAVFVPIIVFAGFKIYKCKNFRKFYIGGTIVLLVLEIIRFFYNASFYSNAATPSEDIKFGFITLLVVLALFASFNQKAGKTLKEVFCLTSLAPIIMALFNSNIYTNALDVNGVCKAIYMIECGVVLTIALFYLFENTGKISPWSILWACLLLGVFVGGDAAAIYYWNIATPFDIMWYLSWSVSIVAVPISFGIILLAHNIHKHKQKD